MTGQNIFFYDVDISDKDGLNRIFENVSIFFNITGNTCRQTQLCCVRSDTARLVYFSYLHSLLSYRTLLWGSAAYKFNINSSKKSRETCLQPKSARFSVICFKDIGLARRYYYSWFTIRILWHSVNIFNAWKAYNAKFSPPKCF